MKFEELIKKYQPYLHEDEESIPYFINRNPENEKERNIGFELLEDLGACEDMPKSEYPKKLDKQFLQKLLPFTLEELSKYLREAVNPTGTNKQKGKKAIHVFIQMSLFYEVVCKQIQVKNKKTSTIAQYLFIHMSDKMKIHGLPPWLLLKEVSEKNPSLNFMSAANNLLHHFVQFFIMENAGKDSLINLKKVMRNQTEIDWNELSRESPKKENINFDFILYFYLDEKPTPEWMTKALAHLAFSTKGCQNIRAFQKAIEKGITLEQIQNKIKQIENLDPREKNQLAVWQKEIHLQKEQFSIIEEHQSDDSPEIWKQDLASFDHLRSEGSFFPQKMKQTQIQLLQRWNQFTEEKKKLIFNETLESDEQREKTISPFFKENAECQQWVAKHIEEQLNSPLKEYGKINFPPWSLLKDLSAPEPRLNFLNFLENLIKKERGEEKRLKEKVKELLKGQTEEDWPDLSVELAKKNILGFVLSLYLNESTLPSWTLKAVTCLVLYPKGLEEVRAFQKAIEKGITLEQIEEQIRQLSKLDEKEEAELTAWKKEIKYQEEQFIILEKNQDDQAIDLWKKELACYDEIKNKKASFFIEKLKKTSQNLFEKWTRMPEEQKKQIFNEIMGMDKKGEKTIALFFSEHAESQEWVSNYIAIWLSSAIDEKNSLNDSELIKWIANQPKLVPGIANALETMTALQGEIPSPTQTTAPRTPEEQFKKIKNFFDIRRESKERLQILEEYLSHCESKSKSIYGLGFFNKKQKKEIYQNKIAILYRWREMLNKPNGLKNLQAFLSTSVGQKQITLIRKPTGRWQNSFQTSKGNTLVDSLLKPVVSK